MRYEFKEGISRTHKNERERERDLQQDRHRGARVKQEKSSLMIVFWVFFPSLAGIRNRGLEIPSTSFDIKKEKDRMKDRGRGTQIERERERHRAGSCQAP